MLRLTGRPRLDIFGLYGRGPLMNVPVLFLANDGGGPAGGAPAVEGGLGAGLGTERERLAVQLVDCTEPMKSPADAHTGVARWLRCQWTYVDRHIYDRSQTSTLANAFGCKVGGLTVFTNKRPSRRLERDTADDDISCLLGCRYRRSGSWRRIRLRLSCRNWWSVCLGWRLVVWVHIYVATGVG